MSFKGVEFILIVAVALSGRAEVALEQRDPPPRANECQNCHGKNKAEYISKKAATHLEHQLVVAKHGYKELACNFCHDKGNHNLLRSSAAFPATFVNPAPVCQQCHSDIYRDWQNGIHGKRVGGWKGEARIQLQCLTCHQAHSVKFKQMEARKAPQRPKLGIEKESH
jgi:hypothetical protein